MAGEHLERAFSNFRIFEHPRERLLRAWTEAKHLGRWWGPEGFTNTFEVFDPRPGGEWRFVMHGPDGRDYPNCSVFAEVGPERIVLDHLSPPRFRVRATFEAMGERTGLTFEMVFETEAECARIRAFAQEANEQNFDRLQAELARMA